MTIKNNTKHIRPSYLVVVAPASFAQTRVLLDEQTLSHADQSLIATHNMPFMYRLSSECAISTEKLFRAIQLILFKHESLRTSLIFKEESNHFIQSIVDFKDNPRTLFAFVESTFETDEQLNNMIDDEKYNSGLFDLSQGLVFRCHIMCFKGMSSNGLLRENDRILFNFHRAVFDHSSMNIFLHDLNEAYSSSRLAVDENASLRYIDCKHDAFYSRSSNHISSSLLFRLSRRTTNANGCCQHVLDGCSSWL